MRHTITRFALSKMNFNSCNFINSIKLVIVLLLLLSVSSVSSSSSLSINKQLELDDEFSNCLSLSCNLPNDPNCNLKWIYDQDNNPDYLSFKLTLTKPNYNGWFAIGFNPNPRRQMIGTNLILIKFSPKFEIYNG